MTTSNIPLVLPPVGELETKKKCSAAQFSLISAVALAALALLACGFATLYLELPFLAQMPPFTTEALLGAGGILLGADALYALSFLCRGKSVETPAQKPVEVDKPLPEQKKEQDKPKEVKEKKERLSLGYAMRLFKNYTPSLALRYPESASLSSFLETCAQNYPEASAAHSSLQQLISIQRELEKEGGDLDKIVELYTTWLKEPTKPFCFFALIHQGEKVEYLLVQLTHEMAADLPDPETFRICLRALQLHHTEQVPLPETPLLAFFQHEKCYLGASFHQFLKVSETDAFRECKRIYKIGLLQQLLTDYPEWRDDAEFRSWVASSIRCLRKEIDGFKPPEELTGAWRKAKTSLHLMEREWLTLPPLKKVETPIQSAFPPLQVPHFKRSTQVAFPGVRAVNAPPVDLTSEKPVLQPPSYYPTFQNKEDVELLQQWHAYFFEAYAQNVQGEILESSLAQFLLHLPTGQSARTLLEQLDESEKNQIVEHLTEIGRLTLTHHVALGRNGLHPSRYLSLLKTFDLLMECLQTIDSCFVPNCTLDVEALEAMLGDAYYDLGPCQKAIIQTLSAIKKKGENTVNFAELHRDVKESQRLMHIWISKGNPTQKNHPGHKDIAAMQTDFEGKILPPAIAHLRTLLVLSESFLAPHLTLLHQKEWYKDREGYQSFMDGLTRQLQENGKEIYNKKELLKVAGTVSDDLHRPILRKEIPSLKVTLRTPYEIQYREEISETLGTPVTPYHALNPIEEGEIRTRLAEGLMAELTQAHHIDQDGFFEQGSKDTPDFAGRSLEGLKQTQLKIHQDKFVFPGLTLEASRDLQQMASGRDNRASNALYTLARHSHLLMNERLGKDFRSLLRIYLFRSTLLIEELTNKPESAELILCNFDKLLQSCENVGDFKTWAFVYKMHTDMLSSLKRSSLPTGEREMRHHHATKKLQGWIMQAEKGDPAFATSRTPLHLAYLYNKAVLGYTPDERKEIAKSMLMAKSQMERLLLTSPLDGQILYDFSQIFTSTLVDLVEEEGLHILDEILAYRLKNDGKPRVWNSPARGVYQAEGVVVDLNHFKITRGNTMEGILPREIREEERYKLLFGEKALKEIYTYTYVDTPLGKAWHVSLIQGETLYNLYLRSEDSNFPLIYRTQGDKEQEQLIHILENSPTLPIDFKKGYLWSSKQGAVVEDPKGKTLYTPYFEGPSLTKIERHTGRKRAPLLDPKEDRLFSKLDDPDGFVVTQTPDGPLVTYLRGSAQYKWNATEQKWESTLYKGYFLSDKPFEAWIPPGHQRGAETPPFFSSTFTRYHTLENKEGKGKLILLNRPFGRSSVEKEGASREMKHARTLIPLAQSSFGLDKRAIIAFDLEPHTPLKSKRPTDFLYLAYLLYIQGRYGDALLYLQRSGAVWTATDPQEQTVRNQLKERILSWPDPSLNANAFKIKMLLLEHQLRESTFASTEEILACDAQNLDILFELAHQNYYIEDRVDRPLQLTSAESSDLELLLPRAFKWVRLQLAKETPSPLIDEETKKYYLNEGKDKTPEEILQWSLDRAIKKLEEEKPRFSEKGEEVPEEYHPLPLYDVSAWLKPIRESEGHHVTQQRVEKLTEELREVFDGDSEADFIGRELATDITRYAEKVEGSMTIETQASLDELEERLMHHEATLLNEENLHKQRILYQFQPPALGHSQNINRRLQEQEALFDSLFETARHCLWTDNFSPLTEIDAIGFQQIAPLKESLRTYEIARTDRRLTTRKREAVVRLKGDPQNEVLQEECAALLQEWRQYDSEKHPYAPINLLLEDDLNLTARPSQMRHIHNFMAHPNSYYHEAMAGGKTVFLRNAISAIENLKGRLAGVVTYGPLMAMHHKDYADINSRALGSTAYPIYYNRNAPHDVTAIKLMILYHLKALSRHGRIDQTVQSVISLNHTLTELICSLRQKDPQVLLALKPSINALQKLLRLRNDLLSIYADEIDKIFDPLKDFNYSIGSAEVLTKEFYEPALFLMRLLKEEPSLQKLTEALRKKELPEMHEREFEELLRKVAEFAMEHYHLPFDKEIALDYLTAAHLRTYKAEEKHIQLEKQNELVSFYREVVLTHEDPQAVFHMQMCHSYIGMLLRGMKNKMVGTDFGRSEDGISVKPFIFSAVCQESSQRKFPLATVGEITIDYLVNGIGSEGTKAYLAKMKANATEEAVEVTLEETETAIRFKQRFGLSLSTVQERHLEHITKTLEGDVALFEECLCEILLKNFTYYPSKLEGHAHHLSHLIGFIAGSSGSPERVKTLPNLIQKHADLIRQLGAIGSVFYALLKDFDDERDIIARDPTQPIAKQIASLLGPGDTLVDNKPYFSGKTGLEIVEDLSAQNPALPSFRLLDKEGDTCTWNKEHLKKGEEGVDLTQVVSVVDHKGRQGTNWTFAKGKKGIVECGVKTELTSFYQSLMRFRLLGKGQRAQMFYDDVLEKRWAEVPKLQGKSRLCKLIWTLVHNEDALLKPLNMEANRKVILEQETAALDLIKLLVEDMEALAAIKELPEFYLIKDDPLDPKKCGHPVILEQSPLVLQNLAQQKRENLEALKAKIAELDIDKGVIELCSGILDKQIEALNDPALILDPSYLPDLYPSNHSNQDATEQLEVDVVATAEAQADVDVAQNLSLEVDTELDMEAQVSTEIESTLQKHPDSHEGREWPDQALGAIDWYALELYKMDTSDYYLHPTFFPNTFTSYFSLGLYQNQHHEHEPNKEKRVWVFGRPEKEGCFGAKAQMFIRPDGEIFCLMGSVKDADFYFGGEGGDDTWIDTPFEEATRGDLSRFGKEQQQNIKYCFERAQSVYDEIKGQRGGKWVATSFLNAFMQARQTPPQISDDFPDSQKEALKMALEEFKKMGKSYNGWQKRALFYQNSLTYNIDLRETSIPSSLPQKHRKVWIERVALAKLLYVEALFSSEEEAFLMEWLDNPPIPLKTLEANLRNYLNRFYPNTIEKNQLLRILTRKLQMSHT